MFLQAVLAGERAINGFSNRRALPCALAAEIIGVPAAIGVSHLFSG